MTTRQEFIESAQKKDLLNAGLVGPSIYADKDFNNAKAIAVKVLTNPDVLLRERAVGETVSALKDFSKRVDVQHLNSKDAEIYGMLQNANRDAYMDFERTVFQHADNIKSEKEMGALLDIIEYSKIKIYEQKINQVPEIKPPIVRTDLIKAHEAGFLLK